MKKISLLFVLLSACATPPATTNVVWVEDDKRAIDKPEEYWSGLYWDGADKMVFRPLSRFWLFEVKGPAENVNVLEEVPNSSWYTNRLALNSLSPEVVANGPCKNGINLEGPIIVKGGKVDGANPGFRVKDPSTGQNYLLKFDSADAEPYRATAGDVIGSKIYWAAGFETPCNQVIYFDPKILVIDEDESKKDVFGNKTRMTQADVDSALQGVSKNKDGKIRGSSSLFVDGTPIGPFTYEGTRADDPNDIIPHENRRELRGSRLLGAWTNHFDAREQNTLTSFIEGEDGKGYVQHYIIDFGDIFGSKWESDQMSRRFGHSYYFDTTHILEDLFGLGLIVRPWDVAKEHTGGAIFGYYDVERFEPEKWQDAYPNASFNFMDDTDAYWMTRIISRYSDAHIDALILQGKIPDAGYREYLGAMLRGRRDKIVHHYFGKMSALDRVTLNATTICMQDLLVVGGYGSHRDAFYHVSVDGAAWQTPASISKDGICHPAPTSEKFEIKARVRRASQSTPAKPVTFRFQRRTDGLALVKVIR